MHQFPVQEGGQQEISVQFVFQNLLKSAVKKKDVPKKNTNILRATAFFQTEISVGPSVGCQVCWAKPL